MSAIASAVPPSPSWRPTADQVFLGLLVVFFPLTVAAHFFFSGAVTFILAAFALIPLARLMGEATEAISAKLGAGLGGFMNASFGNAAELIIAIAALKNGQTAVVKASITGSILGNLLLVLGASVLAGGLTRKTQKFNATAALSSAALMFLAVVGLTVPDLFHVVSPAIANPVLRKMSIAISVILLGLYGLSLLFSLKTHAHLYGAGGDEAPSEDHWSVRKGIVVLVLATLGVVVVAEILVHALEEAIASFGFTHTFVGVVVIAIIGNAAEHSTAILTAMKDKIDISFNIAFESSKQIALFVAPVLVLMSGFLGHPLTLEFSHMEVLGLALAVGAATLISLDGESNWLEGAMLLAVYAILGTAFFYIP